jgi:hypothetical protein
MANRSKTTFAGHASFVVYDSLTGCWKDSYAISDQPYAKYPLISLSILQEFLGNLLNPEKLIANKQKRRQLSLPSS